MKLLLIDDNPEFAETAQACLEEDGFDVVVCQTATEAVAQLDFLKQFDGVFLDIMMRLGPSLVKTASETGIILYRRIREKAPELPIVILSAKEKSAFWAELSPNSHTSYHSKSITSNIRIGNIIKTMICK